MTTCFTLTRCCISFGYSWNCHKEYHNSKMTHRENLFKLYLKRDLMRNYQNIYLDNLQHCCMKYWNSFTHLVRRFIQSMTVIWSRLAWILISKTSDFEMKIFLLLYQISGWACKGCYVSSYMICILVEAHKNISTL